MSELPEAVVVFGASGFIGRNIVEALRGRVGTLIGVTKRQRPVPGCDIVTTMREVASLAALPASTAVVNAAAAPYNAKTFAQDQGAILSENVAVANAVYEFCASRAIEEVRLASSVAVYPASCTLLDDGPPLNLNEPPNTGELAYAWSKRWAEICADIYLRRNGINTIAFRLSNPYGLYDGTDVASAHVVAAFVIKALMPGDTFEILGDPRNERDFVFAGDVAAIFVESLRRRGVSGAYNLGFGQTVTIHDLAVATLRAAGKAKQIVAGPVAPGAGVKARAVKTERLRREFDVPPFASLDQGMVPTMAWYREALTVPSWT
jgi:nucleoside-diphosphate-sugar epimerase